MWDNSSLSIAVEFIYETGYSLISRLGLDVHHNDSDVRRFHTLGLWAGTEFGWI